MVEIRLLEIAQFLGCTVEGNKEALIRGVAPLDQAQVDDLSFIQILNTLLELNYQRLPPL